MIRLSNSSGAHEWAPTTANFIRGCIHDCIYCYAKAYAIDGGRCMPEMWCHEIVNQYRLLRGDFIAADTVMFPSSHDITPQHLREAMYFLERLLEFYPKVLVVSKPHRECIEVICERFQQFRDRIVFRFTIGSANDSVLGFWEPNAPKVLERMECLELAHKAGYQTSVSCEPMLDDNVGEVVRIVRPFVTESIWLGKANELIDRCVMNGYADPVTMARAVELLDWQTDERLVELHGCFGDDPLIRMKQSIRKVVYDE
jgi:DNA repair photolyase